MPERIQKILSQWGIASRRQAEQMILAGRVRLNGELAQLGQKVDLLNDSLEVDGQIIDLNASDLNASDLNNAEQPVHSCAHEPDRAQEPKKIPAPSLTRPSLLYLLLHKPAGIVCTCDDPQQRPTVLHLLPPELRQGQGLHPVGRLDADSTGALILTNDGDLTYHLTHPRHQIPKTYEVWVAGQPSEGQLDQWRSGLWLDDRLTQPAVIHILRRTPSRTLLQIILREGRKRQIRRIAQQLGHGVLQLHRSAIGTLTLHPPDRPGLAPGDYRFLEIHEIASLMPPTRPITPPGTAQTKEWQRV